MTTTNFSGQPAPPPPPPVAFARGPLSESHYSQVRQAVAARRRVRSAARTARSSGITTLAIGILALACTLLSFGWVALVVSAGVCAVGAVELVGSGRMRRCDPAAARLLCVNQLALLGLVIVYCAIQMATFSPETALPVLQRELAALPDMQHDIARWAPLLTYVVYSLVAVLSIGLQGGMALYYITRRKHVQACNAQTPPWIARLLDEIEA